ncbi:MAG: putative ABC transporter permease [Candidatus Weimeria sp.]|nr:putative ABC transporter permease [Lachnospiraceae bacterium]MEE3355906.1 putative ABC transporter permease [Candidatus Weimeria sp.]
MIIARLFNYFVVFSVVGWLYECTYCTFKRGAWENRGFLFGPVCPIYGSGVVLSMVVFHILPKSATGEHPLWQIFLICAAGSMVLEYVTSYVLEKLFHAVWWDYSTVPLNINGRVCLPATCGFGLAGVLVVRVIMPFVEALPEENYPLLNELFALIFMFIMGIDMALTVASLTKIVSQLERAEASFNEKADAGYQKVRVAPAAFASAASDAITTAGSSAKDAILSAGSNARDAMSSAGESMNERLNRVTESLSWRDRYHLHTMKGYRPVKRVGVNTDAIREFYAKLQEKIQVKK